MLTILELGHADRTRLDGIQDLLEGHGAKAEVQAGVEPRIKWVFVQPAPAPFTQALGYQLIVEHVTGPRWALHTPEHALVDPRRLLDLVQLYRPSAIVCRSPLLAPLLARVVSARLVPRPVVIGAWIDEGPGEWAVRGLGSLGPRVRAAGSRLVGSWTELGLASFDALFVTSKAEARRIAARRSTAMYYVPRGVDLDRFCDRPGSEGSEGGPSGVFVDVPAGVSRAQLRELDVELCRRLPRDPELRVHAPALGDLDRFVARREGIRGCASGEVDARVAALRCSELALILPGVDDGRSAVAEAMATGCPVITTRARGEAVEASGCGRTLAPHEQGAPDFAAAAVELLRGGTLAQLRGHARSHAQQGYELRRCLARELACVRDLIHAKRGRGGVRPGLRELEPPPSAAALSS